MRRSPESQEYIVQTHHEIGFRYAVSSDNSQSRHSPRQRKWAEKFVRGRAFGASTLLSFAALRFHGLGCGKSPISVGLCAQGARMQFTSFADRCATSRTRYGRYLLGREFLGFHDRIMHRPTVRNCSLLLILNTLANRQDFILEPAAFFSTLSKSEHLGNPHSERIFKGVAPP